MSGSWLADLVLHGLSEPSGVQEASGDIVIQVGEAQGDASQVCFDAPIHCQRFRCVGLVGSGW